MKKLIKYTAAIILLFALNAKAQPAKAWKSIFNGKDIQGWTIVEKIANVHIADSSFIIHMTTGTHRHNYIRTNKKYKDFILELDCKKDSLYDSGIMLRCVSTPDSLVGLQGYQIKLDPHMERKWTGGIFDDFGDDTHFRSHWFYSLENDARARAAFKYSNQWNHFRIEAIGDNIKVWVNDIPVTNMLNDKYKEGYIALKLHYSGNKQNEKYSAQFKNIRIIDTDVPQYIHAMDISAKRVY